MQSVSDGEAEQPFFRKRPNAQSREAVARMMEEAKAAHAEPIVPSPDVHYESAGLAHDYEYVMLGLCGDFALALRGPPETTKELKKLWVAQERTAFHESWKALVHAYKGIWTREAMLVELERLKLIGTLDMTLKEPCEMLIAWMKKRLDRMKDTGDAADSLADKRKFDTIPVAKRSQPAGQFAYSTLDLEPAPAEGEDVIPRAEIQIAACDVPKKAPRKEGALVTWKPLAHPMPWNVAQGTLPVVGFNQSHLVAVYAPSSGGAALTMECGRLERVPATGKYRYVREWKYGVKPPVTRGSFAVHVRVSPGGTIALALRNWVYVTHTTMAPGRALQIRLLEHVLVTSTWICDESRAITWSTQRGECFQWNWAADTTEGADAQAQDVMETMLTPLEEPVLSVRRDPASGGCWVAQTFMSVVGRLTPGGVFKALPMERPLAVAWRGPMLFVLTKYGKLEVFRPGQKDSPLRGLLKVKQPIPMVYQHAYDGLWVYEKQNALAALLPNGAVHYFEWKE